MFHLLDATLAAMLDDTVLATVLPELDAADVSFITPDKTFPPSYPTVNLFLYETRRTASCAIRCRSSSAQRPQRPASAAAARRLRLHGDGVVGRARGGTRSRPNTGCWREAFNWLSRFPVIPDRYLQLGGLTGQVFAPPTLVAQMDAAKNVGEFWSRARHCAAAVLQPDCHDHDGFGSGAGRGVPCDHRADDLPADRIAPAASERIAIGGTVRDKASNTVRDAWVRLEPAGLTTHHRRGRSLHFRRTSPRGTGMTLRARAPGKGEATTPAGFQIPSLTGNYDLQFPN